MIVSGFAPNGDPSQRVLAKLTKALEEYAKLIEPWAQSVAAFMVADVAKRNERDWIDLGREMRRGLREEIRRAPTAAVYQQLQAEQVRLITSLPLEAAERVNKLATELGLVQGQRAEVLVKEIMATGEVTESRAKTIARTEIGRASTNLTEARSLFVGSPGYIWRTSRDGQVRDSHRAMEGKYVRWDKPPKTDKGIEPYHAGAGPNCRCYPEPIIPDF